MKSKIIKLLTFFTLVFSLISFSQNLKEKHPVSLDYNWSALPEKIDPDTNSNASGAIILGKNIVLEYYFDEKGNLFTYETEHFRYKVISNKALDELNKIYISLDDVIDIINIKARFIGKNNKVVEVDKEHMKLVENLDSKGNFKIFAIEGAEIGGVIEYFYVLKKNYQSIGSIRMQSSAPIKSASFKIISPRSIGFIAKSYNGFNEIKDTLIDESDVRYYQAQTENIPGLSEERYSAYDASLMRIEYTIAYNYANSRNRIYSYNTISKELYNSLMSDFNDGEKSLKKLIKDIDFGKIDIEQKISKIDNYIKTNFKTLEANADEINNINEIVKKRYGRKKDIIKLYLSIIKELDINFELILTCDRFEKKFDNQFDSYNYLDYYLIYFPDVNKFLSPTDYESRLGYIPYKFETNYALFLRTIKVGEVESFVPSVRKIPQTSSKQNADTLSIVASLSEDLSSLKYSIYRSFSGVEAMALQPYIGIMEESDRKKMVDQIFDTESHNVLNEYNILNYAEEDLYKKPLIINAQINAPNYIEIAGRNVLVKVGDLIGPQAELYQDKARKLPVEANYSHHYFRKIIINIPNGYNITNSNDLIMNVVLVQDGKETAGFKSNFEIQNSQIIIIVSEFYDNNTYPKDKYNEFRNVINAASDFNKKILIINKL